MIIFLSVLVIIQSIFLILLQKPKENKTKKCNVCGFDNIINKDKIYVARENYSAIDFKKYDAIDCVRCGCQIILKERKEKTLR